VEDDEDIVFVDYYKNLKVRLSIAEEIVEIDWNSRMDKNII
jgi:hypothetical protein